MGILARLQVRLAIIRTMVRLSSRDMWPKRINKVRLGIRTATTRQSEIEQVFSSNTRERSLRNYRKRNYDRNRRGLSARVDKMAIYSVRIVKSRHFFQGISLGVRLEKSRLRCKEIVIITEQLLGLVSDWLIKRGSPSLSGRWHPGWLKRRLVTSIYVPNYKFRLTRRVFPFLISFKITWERRRDKKWTIIVKFKPKGLFYLLVVNVYCSLMFSLIKQWKKHNCKQTNKRTHK